MNFSNATPEEITLVDSAMSPTEVLRYIAQTAVMMGDAYLLLYHRLSEDGAHRQHGFMSNADDMAGWAIDFYAKYARNYNDEANDFANPWHKDYPDADCWDDAVMCYCWDRIKTELGPALANVSPSFTTQYRVDLEAGPKELRKLFKM